MFGLSLIGIPHTFPSAIYTKFLTQIPQHHPWKNFSTSSTPSSTFSPVTIQPETSSSDDIKIEERPKLRWMAIGKDITETQKQAISQLPPKMSKRCKAVLTSIICLSFEGNGLSTLLSTWVKIMKPRRADWLLVLKELNRLEHPLILEVSEFALLEESFEANVRDYTKMIIAYSKKNRLQDAEHTFQAMITKEFTPDQVTYTVLINMYSKSGNFSKAEDTFEEMKLLGFPLDKRSYGSMIMAYIRAGMLKKGEILLKEMEAQEIFAGKEVYKALLRAYSMEGNIWGAQTVFDAIQFAGIVPDERIIALLMNAYAIAGMSDKARSVLENLRAMGMKPNDKCITVILGCYEKENDLTKAMALLTDLEKDGVILGKEALQILDEWFRRLGVMEQVQDALREYTHKESISEFSNL